MGWLRKQLGWILWGLFTVCCVFSCPIFLVDSFGVEHAETYERNREPTHSLAFFHDVFGESGLLFSSGLFLLAIAGTWAIPFWAAAAGRLRFWPYAFAALAATLLGVYGNWIVFKEVWFSQQYKVPFVDAAWVFAGTILPMAFCIWARYVKRESRA